MKKLFWPLTCAALVIIGSGLAAAQRVSIAVFEPHEDFLNASTSYGLAWDILKLAAEEANVELIEQAGSWDGSINRLKNHKVDLLFGVLKTPERESWLSFSHPLVPERSRLYTLASNPVTTPEQIDIPNATVGAVAESVHQKLAIEMGFRQIYPVNDSTNLYQMLKSKRLDYVVLGVTMARYYCQNEATDYGADCLKPVGEVLIYSNVHLASLKNNESADEVVSKLNHGIQSVYTLPQVSTLFLQHGFSETDYRQWREQMKAFFAEPKGH